MALDPPQEPPDRRTRIVEAARSEFRKTGLAGTSLAAIAQAAGVRRTHLYRYFDDKADLVSAVVAAETAEVNARRAAELESIAEFGEQVARSLELAVSLIHGDPFWSSLVEPGNVPYTAYAATQDPALIASNEAYWQPILEHARQHGAMNPALNDQDVMTWLLGLQFLFLERREIFDSAAEVRRYTELFVLPAIVHGPSTPAAGGTT